MLTDLFVTTHLTPRTYRIGLLSTYPPKHCGLATFAAALENGLLKVGHRVEVVGIADGEDNAPTKRLIAAELVNGDLESQQWAVAVLSTCDVAIIQHEYGIYGGADGDEVIDLLRSLHIPKIVTLHTVPLHPTLHQKSVLTMIGDIADRVVVMSKAARDLLINLYLFDRSKVVTIPHGASAPSLENVKQFGSVNRQRPQLLTWGLLGPGKGIEHVIDALALLTDMNPRPNYTIAGVTHPKVLARDGEQYRCSLIDRARKRGVGDQVTFDDRYRDVAAMGRFVASALAVILPYDSREQVTSGVLVDSIAAGRPVIATTFPHAVELLKDGAGILVPPEDPQALADAIRTIISDPRLSEDMAMEARHLAMSFSWYVVASEYGLLVDELVHSRKLVSGVNYSARSGSPSCIR
jgi:glycosyltransferase involved in cell wall biosynthesis